MLVVRVEIWPGGDARYAYGVGEIIAANRSNLSPISRYDVLIRQNPAPHIGIAGWERKLTVDDHHRAQGVWTLVAAILNAVDCTGPQKSEPEAPHVED